MSDLDWQPMDTAPKDGSVIEIRCASGEIRKVRWGSWTYQKFGTDTWWCSATAGWTLTRRYAPEAWRPTVPKAGGGE